MCNTQQTSQPEPLSEEPLITQPVKTDLKAERVQDSLRAIPTWSLDETGTAIRRTRQFGRLAEAEAYAGFVGTLASSKRQPVTVTLAGKRVEITLTGQPQQGRAGGLTKAVFKLAALIG
jgi:pterin-4a-carbinolamine dehydratase